MKKRSQQDEGYLLEAAETSTLGRFYVNCALCEMHYFPFLIADDFQQKVGLERHLNALLNLDRARGEGLIENYSIRWRRMRNTGYPCVPISIFLRLGGGRLFKLELPRPLLAEVERLRLLRRTAPF